MELKLCFPCWLIVLLALSPLSSADDNATKDVNPVWPIGVTTPADLAAKIAVRFKDGQWIEDERAVRSLKSSEAHVEAWVPEGVTKIRGIFMTTNNTDSVKVLEHRKVREIATKHELAVVYFKLMPGSVIERANPPRFADEYFETMLGLLADETGIKEFRHAPWITLGKSSRGNFTFRPSWQYPDRVVASIAYHGETPTWPMQKWSKITDTNSIMHLNIQGLTEWDGTWYRHVRPSLLNYNKNANWRAHQMVIYGVDHGYYADYYIYPNHGQRMEKNHKHVRCTDVWDYIALHIDKAMTLRVPKDSYATDGPIKLINVDRASGMLIHPRAIEELHGTKWFAFRKAESGDYVTIRWPDEVTPVYDDENGKIDYDKLIVPAKDVPEEERGHYMWVADEQQARAWLKFHNIYATADRVFPNKDEAKK